MPAGPCAHGWILLRCYYGVKLPQVDNGVGFRLEPPHDAGRKKEGHAEDAAEFSESHGVFRVGGCVSFSASIRSQAATVCG